MPTKVQKLQTGLITFTHTCEVCQGFAYIGYGFDGQAAIKSGRAKEKEWWRHLGNWFCSKHDRGGK